MRRATQIVHLKRVVFAFASGKAPSFGHFVEDDADCSPFAGGVCIRLRISSTGIITS